MADIKLRFSTIDHFRETKTFKSFKGARAYAQRRIGTHFDISETFGYAVDMHGVGKLEIVGGDMDTTLMKLLQKDEADA
jgi:hypothetical protein